MIYFLVYGISIGIQGGYDWYVQCNGTSVGVKDWEWTVLAQNFDSAVWMMLMMWNTICMAMVFSFGFEHRYFFLRNWCLVLMCCGLWGFIMALVWTGPNEFTCIFTVNCDVPSSLNVANVAFFAQLSTASIGGCFLGPQLCDIKAELGGNYITPSLDTDPPCIVAANTTYIGPTYDNDGTVCQGPNNCWGNDMKTLLTALFCGSLALLAIYHVMVSRVHPAKREHFKRL
jgi:hypothetical protein